VAIIDLLTNDPWVGYDVADYTRVMTLLIQHEQAIGAEVLVVVAPISNIQDAAELPTYTAALLEVASSLNVPVVNIQSTWGTTYNPNSGFWSPDGIHPNSLGCINEFQLIQPAVHI
jgi:lysophospholipase L1-like esterase